jgi:2-amino-4-hydroxy-6-hydroxymethyldihydropteridine diphosphokinase
MATVYVGLGSNVEPEKNLQLGVRELRSRYGDLELSPVYRGAAVGFDGDDFLNLVVAFRCDDSPEAIHEQIEIVHDLSGRKRGGEKFADRPLDIDLLLYDDRVLEHPRFTIPRADVLEYGFVLRPLADMAPALRHPQTGKTMQEHWEAFDASRQPLVPVRVIL